MDNQRFRPRVYILNKIAKIVQLYEVYFLWVHVRSCQIYFFTFARMDSLGVELRTIVTLHLTLT